MKVNILAGGEGTRIGELYCDLPKSMIPICGKPLLLHQIELLVSQGFTDITLIVGYKNETIRQYFGNGEAFGAVINYIIEKEPLGTGGSLKLLPKEDTLIIFGDLYLDVNFKHFIHFHKNKNAGVTLFTHPNSHPYDSDIVVADNEGKVLSWKSKKDEQRGELRNLVNAGLYVFDKEYLPDGEVVKLDLEHDVILPIINHGKVYAYRSTEYVKDMGTPERLYAVEKDVNSGVTRSRNLKNKQKAVFIDRDGTLNEFRGLIYAPEQIELIPKAAQAIKVLNNSQFLVICVTNQPVIARGMITFDQLDKIHARIDTLLGQEGAYLDDLIFCPHHPDKGYPEEAPEYKINCVCRKPEPGMLLEAAKRHNIDLTQSYMIGDATADIMAGSAAGCKTIGVKTGERLSDNKYNIIPDTVCEDLMDAIRFLSSGDDL